jgi:hypothetical protein
MTGRQQSGRWRGIHDALPCGERKNLCHNLLFGLQAAWQLPELRATDNYLPRNPWKIRLESAPANVRII